MTTNNIAIVILTTNTSYFSHKILQGLRVNVVQYFHLIVSEKKHMMKISYITFFSYGILNKHNIILEFGRKIFFHKIVWAFENNVILN